MMVMVPKLAVQVDRPWNPFDLVKFVKTVSVAPKSGWDHPGSFLFLFLVDTS